MAMAPGSVEVSISVPYRWSVLEDLVDLGAEIGTCRAGAAHTEEIGETSSAFAARPVLDLRRAERYLLRYLSVSAMCYLATFNWLRIRFRHGENALILSCVRHDLISSAHFPQLGSYSATCAVILVFLVGNHEFQCFISRRDSLVLVNC